jgi:tRNA nucleotidyltransferase (CCA-adding enzyme)
MVENVSTTLQAGRRVAEAVRAAGGRALVVGGWVRDRLRGHPSKDIDLEVFGIGQERLASLLASLGRVEAVGQSFAVYKLTIGRDSGDPAQGLDVVA